MHRKSFIIRLLLAISCTVMGSQLETSDTLNVPAPEKPLQIQLQYAGNMGLMSGGIGKSFFTDNFSLYCIYGYLPKNINGVIVHTLAVRTQYSFINMHISKNSLLGAYAGTSVMRGFAHNTFVELPDYYPSGYYQPTAYHLAIFTGMKHTKLIKTNKSIKHISAFFELGTLDYMLWYALKTSYIKFPNIWNLSFGVTLHLNMMK